MTFVNPFDALTSSTDGRGIVWEWAEYVDYKLRRVKCKLCSHVMSSGINRFKDHIIQKKGQVKSCPKATPEMMKKVTDIKKEKNEKRPNKERIDRLYEDVKVIVEKVMMKWWQWSLWRPKRRN
ncbi:hypothetical protein MKX01_015721 [Papaver californicum]|nr:hypothetical protein MKX01_015721 [Papaver californicum]